MNENNGAIGREYTYKEFLSENHVVIPAYQRDYAQGRTTRKAGDIRERILENLKDALINENPRTLDFAYGQRSEDGSLVLVDGQQRMTTLFLLHWYSAYTKGVIREGTEGAWGFLRSFTYETRYSSREFFKLLLDPTFCEKLRNEKTNGGNKQPITDIIRGRREVPKEWSTKDPTVSAALTMLDAIEGAFGDVITADSGLWDKLVDQRFITFHFIGLEDMGETDQLYIRMNSRGRPLTAFENTKAELLKSLREAGRDDDADEIGKAMDGAWADMVWPYRADKESGDIGHEMLNFFKFVCDLIWFKNNDTRWNKEGDAKNRPHELIKMLFSSEPQVGTLEGNIRELKTCFQCWAGLGPEKINEFFDENLTSAAHEEGKVPVPDSNNLLEFCLRTGWKKRWNWDSMLPDLGLPSLLRLYACTYFLISKDADDKLTFNPEDLRRFRRIINLIRNSDNVIRDDEQVSRGKIRDQNHIPAMLKQIENIIDTGHAQDMERGFNAHQLGEEKEKAEWLQASSSDYARDEQLFAIEDHPFLGGQVSAIQLDPEEFEHRLQAFAKLFDGSLEKEYEERLDRIDCALMAIGDPMQRMSNSGNYQSSSKYEAAWTRNSGRAGLLHLHETEHTALNKLLDSIAINNEIDDQLEEIVQSFLENCKKNKHFPFAYYYVTYDAFRSASYSESSYGVYHWTDKAGKPYELLKLETPSRISNAAVQPFLAEVAPDKIDWRNNGWSLYIDGHKIECVNDGFTVDDELVVRIPQEESVDTVDRVKVLEKYLSERGWLTA